MSARRAALLLLPIQDVVLVSPWQRQEAHEDGGTEVRQTVSSLTGGLVINVCFQSRREDDDLLLLHHSRLQLGAKGQRSKFWVSYVLSQLLIQNVNDQTGNLKQAC